MKFKCEQCGRITNVGSGAMSLTCQTCGSYDIQFDTSVSIIPLIMGNEWGKEVIVKKGEPFLGLHANGCVWKIRKIELLPEQVNVSDPSKLESATTSNPVTKKLVKAVRKLADLTKKEK